MEVDKQIGRTANDIGNELDKLRRLIVETYKSDSRRAQYFSYVEGLISKGLPPILSFAHLAEILSVEKERLRNIIFHSEFYYSKFYIPKRTGGFREISAPFSDLDIMQRWILSNLLQFAQEEVIPNVVGYIRDKSILDHVSPHLSADCLVKFDLKDFFPTIKVPHVTKIFMGLGYTIKVSRTLAGLVTMDGHLPQGAATSPQISNIFMRAFDSELLDFCSEQGFSFTRYADDIVVSGDDSLLSQIENIQEIFYRHKLVINSSKTRVYRRPSDVRFITGLMVHNGRVRLPKAMRRQIRSEAFTLARELECFANGGASQQKNFGFWADPVFIDRILGKLNYWEFVDSTDYYPKFMRQKIKDLLVRFE